jgi:hypothetical protein
MHKRFKHLRQKGEWFWGNQELKEYIGKVLGEKLIFHRYR